MPAGTGRRGHAARAVRLDHEPRRAPPRGVVAGGDLVHREFVLSHPARRPDDSHDPRRRDRAWWFATVATVASVLGGYLGYVIGFFLFETVGQAVIDFYRLQEGFVTFRDTFNTYGGWIVLIKGMTPIPYKLITITAGVTHLDLGVFTVSSLARGPSVSSWWRRCCGSSGRRSATSSSAA